MNGVVEIARGWIGTPYVHQASLRGVGADCLGLIRGVWRELHGTEPEVLPAYAPDWSEVQREERLWDAAQRHLCEKSLDCLEPGDVLLFRLRQSAVAQHLGIASSDGRFIHAYSRHGVIENALSAPWRRRIVARFTFPDPLTDRSI